MRPRRRTRASTTAVKSSGVTRCGIAYTVQGSGPPLLWSSGYVVPATAMDGMVRRFAGRFTCITFDHRGSGRSRSPVVPLTTARMARDALRLMRHLDVTSAHVYGVSLGGMVAQELAVRAPHRVRTLVLGSTTAGGVAVESPSPVALLREMSHAWKSGPGRSRVGVRGAVHQGWAAATHDTSSRLHRIQAPTLIIHGSRDKIVPPSDARRLADHVPGAELRVVRGAGHLFLFESRTATDLVARWLDARRNLGARGRRSLGDSVRDLTVEPWRAGIRQTLPLRRMLHAP